MRRALALATVLLASLVFVAPAAPADPVKQLRAQVKALQAQVKALKTQVTQAKNTASVALTFSVCESAATADAFQGTWLTLDQQVKPMFGAQTPVNDQGSCDALRITRAKSQVPPSVSVFNALFALFSG